MNYRRKKKYDKTVLYIVKGNEELIKARDSIEVPKGFIKSNDTIYDPKKTLRIFFNANITFIHGVPLDELYISESWREDRRDLDEILKSLIPTINEDGFWRFIEVNEL